jgi:hypothetical protein
MKNTKRFAVLIAAIACVASTAFTQSASARNDAWKAANQWAVQTWMAQHGGYWPGAYNNGYNYYNNYYNPYYNGYNGYSGYGAYNPYYNPYNTYGGYYPY